MDIRIKYDPVPWASRMHTGTWKNACLVGGLGSGKTTAALRELQACALENPGFTYLIGRKTLPSLRDTTMKTFFDVIEEGFIKSHNKSQNIVTLVNNAEFIFRPLDDMEKFKSLEIAGFFIDEANEVEEDLYMTLKSRVRQQVKEAPPTRYRTIISLNPGEETHWIPQLFLHRKPKDSEIFFSTTMDNMKNLPPNYVEDLMSMYSKDMQQRMLYGQFGKVHKGRPVFPQFQRGNFIRAIDPVQKEIIYRCFDFGFQNPGCVWIQFIDGQLRVLAEKLGKRIYLDDFLQECFEYERGLWGQWPPQWYKAFCDPRGSDESDKGKTSIQILNEHGIYPVHRRTFIEEGIKAIKGLMDGQTNGEPHFLIHDRCGILVEGFRGGYARADGENEPEKDGYYDHLMDCVTGDTTVTTDRGEVEIKDIRDTDLVLTKSGFRKHGGLLRRGVKPVYEVSFSDGTKLSGTENHLVWVQGVGWTKIMDLKFGDLLFRCTEICQTSKPLSWMGLPSDVIQTIKTLALDVITGLMPIGLRRAFGACTGMSGKSIEGLSLPGITFITETMTSTTTRSRTLSASVLQHTGKNIEKTLYGALPPKVMLNTSLESETKQKSGTRPKKDTTGTSNTRPGGEPRTERRLNVFVKNVKKHILQMPWLRKLVGLDSAILTVKCARIGVVRVKRVGSEPVYDINIPVAHHFFANRVLVHNCLRYGAIHLTRRYKFQHAQHVINEQNVFVHPVTGRRIEW